MNTLTFEQVPSYLLSLGEQVSLIQGLLSSSNNTNIDDPLDIEEAARFLKYEIPTIYALVQKRAIPFHKPGKKILFFRSELIEWIKGEKQTSEERFLTANKKPQSISKKLQGA